MDTEAVRQLLAATRSSDKNERGDAETRMEQYAVEAPQNLLPALLAVANVPDYSVADKQSSMLIFKSCVQKFWSPGFEQFTGPPFTHDLRQEMRNSLLQLLVTTNEQKVRNACALVIGQIGSLEYPDQWPDLVKLSLQFLSEPFDSPVVVAGLALFKELLLEAFREEDFMQLGEPICMQLLSIVQNFLNLPSTGNEDDEVVQSRVNTMVLAIQCFHECVTFLLMGDDDQLPHLDEISGRLVPQWVSLLCEVMRTNPKINPLIVEVQYTLHEMESAFGNLMEPQLPLVWDVVLNQVLISHFNELNVELLSHYTLLLVMVLQNSQACGQVIQTADDLSKFCELLLQVSILNRESLEVYIDDHNVFITDELELESGGMSPRTNAAALISMTSRPEILFCLVEVLRKIKTQELSFVQLQLSESCLFLIANVLSQVDLGQPLQLLHSEQLQALLGALEYENYRNHDLAEIEVLLNARKMITASFVAKYCGHKFPEQVRSTLATHCCHYPDILSDETDLVLKSAALRAFEVSTIPTYHQYLAPVQTVGVQLVLELLQNDPEDDTPTFLAECYGSVLKIDYGIVERNQQCVQVLLALAAIDSADIDLNAQIIDVVGEILDAVSQRQVVESILGPILQVVEKGAETQFNYSSELYFAIELLSTILSHENVIFNTEESVRMLNSFYMVITTTEDPQILQVTSFAYAALVKDLDTSGPQQINAETAQNVIKVAARLLSPDLDDSAALASGKLVSAIIDQFGDSLGDLLPELIIASAKRLTSAQNALLVETLVMVFCELTLRNAAAVIDILSQYNLLEQVMRQWLPTFEVTVGADNIRKQIKALELLFELHDPRLEQLMLPDQPIKKPGEVITRRKAKNIQFTQVSASVKILKLLVRELSQAPEQDRSLSAQVNAEDDEEDAWDDELVITEEGEFFDQISYNLILNWFKKLGQQPGMMEYFMKLNGAERQVLLNATKE